MKIWAVIIAGLIAIFGLLCFHTARSKTCTGYDPGNSHHQCVSNCRKAGCEHGYADGTSKCDAHCSNVHQGE